MKYKMILHPLNFTVPASGSRRSSSNRRTKREAGQKKHWLLKFWDSPMLLTFSLAFLFGCILAMLLLMWAGTARASQFVINPVTASSSGLQELGAGENPKYNCETTTPFDFEISQVFTDDCNARRILLWHRDGHSYGENQAFYTQVDAVQRNGSIDRGLYRINSNTFSDFLNRHPGLLHQYGIYKWSDMLDVSKNIRMAKIIYDEQGACAWYASPTDMCSRNYPLN